MRKLLIKNIIFDLGEVYLNGFKNIERKLSPILGLPAEVIRLQISGKVLDDLFKGKIGEEVFWKTIIDENNWGITIDELKKIVRENFSEVAGTREVIEKLKEKGFKLGLLSNHAKDWIDFCEAKYDYQKLYDGIIYSFKAGVRKPDRRIFEMILEKMKADPKETLFIDDYVRNVDGARALGMQAILFTDADQLKKELEGLGIGI